MVSASGFEGLVAGGLLDGQFTTGKVAAGTGAQFVWDVSKGKLFWDADGAGGEAAELIATLPRSTGLTAADFVVVA